MNQTILRIVVSAATAVALSACGSTDDGRADRLEGERDALEAELAALQEAHGDAELTPETISTLRNSIDTLMGRADITPDEAQALQDQVDTLMGRADITTEEVQALQDQVDTLIGRADITPDELQALEQDLKQALMPSWTPLSTGVHRDFIAGTSQPTDAGVTMIESDRRGTFHVTYMVDGVEQRISLTPEEYDGTLFVKRGPPNYWLWDQSNSFTVAPKYKYININGWQVVDFGVGGNVLAVRDDYVVYGTPTEVLPAGTADYGGDMWAFRYSRTSPDSPGTLYGRMELTANFDNSSIEGMFTDMLSAPPRGDLVEWDADILVKEGTIADAGFSAQLEGQRGAAGITGSATGQFFGPDAEEVGGVISAESEDHVSAGYFGGKKTQ